MIDNANIGLRIISKIPELINIYLALQRKIANSHLV